MSKRFTTWRKTYNAPIPIIIKINNIQAYKTYKNYQTSSHKTWQKHTHTKLHAHTHVCAYIHTHTHTHRKDRMHMTPIKKELQNLKKHMHTGMHTHTHTHGWEDMGWGCGVEVKTNLKARTVTERESSRSVQQKSYYWSKYCLKR